MVGVRWCVLCIFLFVKFYNSFKGTAVRPYIVFLKKLKPYVESIAFRIKTVTNVTLI